MSQKINVVLVALDDRLLHDFHAELVTAHPGLTFRKVGVDLSRGDYVSPIAEATKDVDVQLVFNNAGFITAGLFADISYERNLGNYECNATSAVKITHVFLRRMLDRNLRGLIAFTSSSAGTCMIGAALAGSAAASGTDPWLCRLCAGPAQRHVRQHQGLHDHVCYVAGAGGAGAGHRCGGRAPLSNGDQLLQRCR